MVNGMDWPIAMETMITSIIIIIMMMRGRVSGWVELCPSPVVVAYTVFSTMNTSRGDEEDDYVLGRRHTWTMDF